MIQALADCGRPLSIDTRKPELMQEAIARYPIAAWKCYTQWGPEGVGWELDSPDIGIPFIEQVQMIDKRVLEAINRKVDGQEITAEPAQDGGGKIIDLMEALRGSLTEGVDVPGRAWVVLVAWALAMPLLAARTFT